MFKSNVLLLLVWFAGLLTGSPTGSLHTPPSKAPVAITDAKSPPLGVRTATAIDPNDLGWLQSAKESTVVVRTPTGHGSGVCIGWVGDRDLVLTAKHVVAHNGEPELSVVLEWASGDTDFMREAVIQRISQESDLALVSAYDPQHILKPVKLAKYTQEVGELVIAIGFPNDVYPACVTIGFVTEHWEGETLHSATIWFGNSGGPLFNDNGKLIGINVWMSGYNGHAASDRGGAVSLSAIIHFLGE